MAPGLTGTRVLVTGASGFIGAQLVARLAAEGARVHAVVRAQSNLERLRPLLPTIHLHCFDVRDETAAPALMTDVRPAIVFNLATHRSPGGEGDFPTACATNVGGLFNFLKASPPDLRRFVHFGSSTEYGPHAGPIAEDVEPRPTSKHGLVKAAATTVAQGYVAVHALPLVVLRLFHVYGPNDRPSRFIPQAIEAALAGRALALTPSGCRHDWTYVEDIVDGAIAAAACDGPPGEIFNIASGRQWTNEEVVAAVEKVTCRRIRLDDRPHAPRPWDTTSWVADVSKARTRLHWTAQHSLEAGLRKTVEWHARGMACAS